MNNYRHLTGRKTLKRKKFSEVKQAEDLQRIRSEVLEYISTQRTSVQLEQQSRGRRECECRGRNAELSSLSAPPEGRPHTGRQCSQQLPCS